MNSKYSTSDWEIWLGQQHTVYGRNTVEQINAAHIYLSNKYGDQQAAAAVQKAVKEDNWDAIYRAASHIVRS